MLKSFNSAVIVQCYFAWYCWRACTHHNAWCHPSYYWSEVSPRPYHKLSSELLQKEILVFQIFPFHLILLICKPFLFNIPVCFILVPLLKWIKKIMDASFHCEQKLCFWVNKAKTGICRKWRRETPCSSSDVWRGEPSYVFCIQSLAGNLFMMSDNNYFSTCPRRGSDEILRKLPVVVRCANWCRNCFSEMISVARFLMLNSNSGFYFSFPHLCCFKDLSSSMFLLWAESESTSTCICAKQGAG